MPNRQSVLIKRIRDVAATNSNADVNSNPHADEDPLSIAHTNAYPYSVANINPHAGNTIYFPLANPHPDTYSLV